MRATYHTFKKDNRLGRNIKHFRRLRDLTQEQLAFAVYRRSRSYISAIECGLMLPSLYILFDIACVLKVSPTLLFADPDLDNFFLYYTALKPADKREVKKEVTRRLSLDGLRLFDASFFEGRFLS